MGKGGSYKLRPYGLSYYICILIVHILNDFHRKLIFYSIMMGFMWCD